MSRKVSLLAKTEGKFRPSKSWKDFPVLVSELFLVFPEWFNGSKYFPYFFFIGALTQHLEQSFTMLFLTHNSTPVRILNS